MFKFIRKYKIIVLIILNIVIYRYLYTYLNEMIEYYSQDLLCTNLTPPNSNTFLTLEEKKVLFFNELKKKKFTVDQSMTDQIIAILDTLQTKNAVLSFSKEVIEQFNALIIQQEVAKWTPYASIFSIVLLVGILA